MRYLTLVRHTSVSVPAGICYGVTDAGLSETFLQEAGQILAWLGYADLVISSPASRCSLLGNMLAEKFSCELLTEPRLREMSFGAWEGLSWDSIPRAELDAWGRDVLNFAPPDGESASTLMQRVEQCLHEILVMPQQHIVVVTHGGPIRAMLSMLGGLPLQQLLSWQIEQGAVIQLKVMGET